MLLLLAWTGWTLTRLSRLEDRVARAWTALDTQLQRRAGPGRGAGPRPSGRRGVGPGGVPRRLRRRRPPPVDGDRELAENALGRELRELPDNLPGVPAALRTDLAGTTTRVALARRFYNDAVRDTRALRGSRLPRLLRLHAGRPLPRFFDIDDRLDGCAGRQSTRRQPGR